MWVYVRGCILIVCAPVAIYNVGLVNTLFHHYMCRCVFCCKAHTYACVLCTVHFFSHSLCSVKLLICLCLLPGECSSTPVCTPEPTPWVSGVGLSRDEQSGIKSILVLGRQEPLLLLGDASTEGEKRTNPPPPSPSTPVICCLSQFCPLQLSLLPPLLFSVSIVCLPFFMLHRLMLPSLASHLSTVARSLFLLSLSPWSLHHNEDLLAHWHSRRPSVNFKAVLEGFRVPAGSLRQPEKSCPSMRRGIGTNCTLGRQLNSQSSKFYQC